MTIKDRINNDLKDAMRARDSKKLGTLRLITAAIKQIEVDERVTVEDERLLVILDKLAKQRKESISQFQAAKRDDLVAQEEYELDVITHYLPEPLTESEISSLIQQTMTDLGAIKMSDMGKVMAQLKPLLQGRADMAKVSSLIKAKLS
jgi:uncharacterized protein YqeY